MVVPELRYVITLAKAHDQELSLVLARLNAHAEDVTKLTRRVEEWEEAALELAKHISGLAKRIEQLERLLEKEHKKED